MILLHKLLHNEIMILFFYNSCHTTESHIYCVTIYVTQGELVCRHGREEAKG